MRRTASSAVRRVGPLNAAVASDVGMVREENQDRVAVVRCCDRNGAPFILAVLADGIGGMRGGAECAAVTVATFIEGVVHEAQRVVDPRLWLQVASRQANLAVQDHQGREGGSTLAAILFATGYRPLWLSVGDSRVYHEIEGKLTQLSRDDTLEGQLGKPIEGGRKSELLQFIGMGDGLEPHIEFVPWDISGTLLLTSDGVHFIDADILGKVAHFAPDLGVAVRRYIELAKMLGGPDNASVAAISVNALATLPASEVDSSYEIWDPFGEVHVIFDRGRRYASEPPPTAVATDPKLKPLEQARLASDVREPESKAKPAGSVVRGKSPKQKVKGSRKPKAKDANTDDARSTEGETPQLFIEFPRKRP